MQLVVYYERGNNKASLQPDVQVVFGVGRKGNRHSFRVWEEGKAPDFVLEVLSPSTAENEVRHRAMEYAAIGVREYWRLDPAGSLAGRPLEGYTASEGRHRHGGTRGAHWKGLVAAEPGIGAGSARWQGQGGDGGDLP